MAELFALLQTPAFDLALFTLTLVIMRDDSYDKKMKESQETYEENFQTQKSEDFE